MADDLRSALDALVDRLSRLPESKLTLGLDAGVGPARQGHAVAQKLADAAIGAGAGSDPARPLPWVGPFVVADQLAVTGADLLAAADVLDATVLADCLAAVAELSAKLGS